jgi:hypothetical protein
LTECFGNLAEAMKAATESEGGVAHRILVLRERRLIELVEHAFALAQEASEGAPQVFDERALALPVWGLSAPGIDPYLAGVLFFAIVDLEAVP